MNLAAVILALHINPSAPQTSIRIQRVENGLLPAMVAQNDLGKGKSITERMSRYKVPGISIAVINDGKIEWARGYGVIEKGTDQRVTPNTLFQAGSVSKSVAAMGALALVEQHKLDLDEDINKKLTSYKVPDSTHTEVEKVTLARILSHTAGLTVHGFLGYAVDAPMPTLIQVLKGEKPANSPEIKNDMVPGATWRYSGGGYTVMQQLVIDVTKQSYPDFMKQTVLDKLGMTNSTFAQPLDKTWADKTATGHYQDASKVKGRWHVYPEMAAAGLWCTPTDLAKFAIDIQDTYNGRSQKVLSQAMAKQMLTDKMNGDGLGVFVKGTGPSLRFIHSGRDDGFDSMLMAYAESGKGAIIMANANMDNDLMNEILRSIAKEYNWSEYPIAQKITVDIAPAVLKSLVGKYELTKEFVIAVKQKGSQLFVEGTNQPELELVAEAENSFIVVGAGATISFERNEKGEVTNLVLKQNGQTRKAKRIGNGGF